MRGMEKQTKAHTVHPNVTATKETAGILNIGNYIAFSSVGFYVVLICSLSLGLYGREVTIAHRVGVIAIALLAAVLHIKNWQSLQWLLVLSLFFVLYSLRIIQNDMDSLLVQRSASEYLMYLWGTTFLPSIGACALGLKGRNSSDHVLNVLASLAVFSSLSFYFYRDLLSLSGESRGVRSQSEYALTISPLALGYLGAANVLVGLWASVNLKSKIKKIVSIICGAAGLAPILLGASRGPIVGMLIAGGAYTVASFGSGIRSRESGLRALAFLVCFGAAAVFVAATESAAITRLLSMGQDYQSGSSEMVRVELYAEAYKKFADAPILGSHIELENGMYPHNVFLEALMSCGTLGFLYIAVFFRATVAAWRLLVHPQIGWVSVIYFLFLTLNMVSGSIWGADALTMTGMFLIGAEKSPTSRPRVAKRKFRNANVIPHSMENPC
ncbi:MAG: hypothetical protein RLZZ179_12 [Verrucomicrobiota bacterium]|jgi:hypothetical protein